MQSPYGILHSTFGTWHLLSHITSRKPMPKANENDLRSYLNTSGTIIPHLSPWIHLTVVPVFEGHFGNCAACLLVVHWGWWRRLLVTLTEILDINWTILYSIYGQVFFITGLVTGLQWRRAGSSWLAEVCGLEEALGPFGWPHSSTNDQKEDGHP